MKEYKPNTWEELNTYLWQESLDTKGKYRPYIAFRGMSKRFPNPLRTSLQRLVVGIRKLEPKDTPELKWKERRIIDSFKMYARDYLNHGLTDWHTLLLGQHYRLPTRLLDWTSSPLVAMYFASEKDLSEDGEIFCVVRLETNAKLSPTFQSLLQRQNTNLFSLETLSSEFPSMEEFDKTENGLALNDRSLLFFEPPSIDIRIINQFALFSVMTNQNSDALEWLEGKGTSYCWKVIVPHERKKEIRERLSVMNITARTIYPGLEGISQWLRAYYE